MARPLDTATRRRGDTGKNLILHSGHHASSVMSRNPALPVIARSIEADERDAAIPVTHGYYQGDVFHHRDHTEHRENKKYWGELGSCRGVV